MRLEHVPGAPTLISTEFDLARLQYEQAEYFVGGRAAAFGFDGELSVDGRWAIQAVSEASFKTRVVVYTPIDVARFSGTVFFEWINVSTGADALPAWRDMHLEAARNGDVWVSVSVQSAGVEGGAQLMPRSTDRAVYLKAVAPERYLSLSLPGDAYAFDVFRAVAATVRSELRVGNEQALAFIAIGTSQSASFLATFINALGPLSSVFDGYFVHKWPAGSAAPLDGLRADAQGQRKFISNAPVQLRTDFRAKIIVVQPEGDALPIQEAFRAYRQVDDDNFRLWQVAGSAHASVFTGIRARDDGFLGAAEVARALKPTSNVGGYGASANFQCPEMVNTAPQTEYVSTAALGWIREWVKGYVSPPMAPRLRFEVGGSEPVRDKYGIVLGGIRSPWVDVPIAALGGRGTPNDDHLSCSAFGYTRPFDSATLEAIYPGGVEEYMRRFRSVMNVMLEAGFILGADAVSAVAVANCSFPPVV